MASILLRRSQALPRSVTNHTLGYWRGFFSTSLLASAAAAALRTEEADDHYTFQPAARHRTILPNPLPSDVESTAKNSSLYPSTPLLDSLSLLSICLRRPQFIKRAYQIFSQLIADVQAGKAPIPDAAVWAEVTEAIGRNGHSFDMKNPDRAHQVVAELVAQWEVMSKKSALQGNLDNAGRRVYQGWFRGLVFSSSSLEAIDTYIDAPGLPLSHLLEAFSTSELPLALQALSDHASKTGQQRLDALVRQIRHDRDHAIRQQTVQAEPLIPVLSSPRLSRKTASPNSTVDSVQPRFAITNLKSSLASLDAQSLPLTRQHLLEQSSHEAARAELEHSARELRNKKGSAADDQVLQRQQLQSWMFEWMELLSVKLSADIDAMRTRVAQLDPATVDTKPQRWTASSQMKEANLLLYISLLPVEKLALITILEIMRMAGSGGIPDGMKTLRGLLSVGRAVETEYRADTIKQTAGMDSPEWLRTLDPQTQKPNRTLVANVWDSLGKRIASKNSLSEDSPVPHPGLEDIRNVWTPAWSQMVQLSVGSFLVDSLMNVAKVVRSGRHPTTGAEVTELQSAFSHSYEYVRGRLLGVIKLNPVVASRLARDQIGVVIHPKHLPMLVPPRPWRSFDDGAYLIHRVPIMRFKDSAEQLSYLKKASSQGVLEPVYAGLDVLSSTPWKINRSVYDVVAKVWNTGEAIADIPAAVDKATYDLPVKPQAAHADPHARALYIERLKAVTVQQRKDHAERCKFNYNLEIARSYLNDVFYIPHNMDFRGRAYPIPPHLSPVGDDLCRGLLTFGTKRPLGATGLKWLQIHLANVFGFDKASFEDRAQFARQHESDIMDSADRPLEGQRWWLKAEDPWQCLAACFELTAAIRSSDPTSYLSSLPVHQDGTCNGMQHYAALGGDARGARAVNLENGDRPADIYSGVADLVNKVIQHDSAKGVKLAQLIGEPLGRKVVKQTVMTTVYGVTFIGAKDQIAKQLVARGDIAQEHVYAVSGYIAKTVLGCIGDLFGGAKAIQDWLTTAARLIARSIPPQRVGEVSKPLITRNKTGKSKTRASRELMTSVVWTTPLGLPVVQPYRKASKKQVMTALQTVYISDPNAPSEVSPQKQATAFPPNFIHSLDATHMLLTALKCRQNDITFAAVHDSYWTHAASVEPMSNLIRDTFIHLHSQDLVGELRQEFLDRYGDHLIPVKSAQNIAKAAAKRLKEAKAKAVAFADEDSSEDHALTLDELNELSPETVVSLGTNTDTGFVRLADVFPPCPPKGEFDVNKIRASQYFFS